jgi:hypothetical protein
MEYDRLTRQLKDLDAESEAVGAQLLLANQRVTGLETDLETMKVQLVSGRAGDQPGRHQTPGNPGRHSKGRKRTQPPGP